MGQPFIDQDSFRWYFDDSGSISPDGNTAIHLVNVDLSAPVTDTNYLLRYLLQNTGAKALTDGYHLYYRVDVGGGGSFGAWTRVTTTSLYVRSVATAGTWSDGISINQILGSGTYDEGYGDENSAAIASFGFTNGQESENAWVIQFRSADIGGGDIIEIQMRFDDGLELDAYTNTPSTTFPEGEIQQSGFRWRAAEELGDDQTLNANGAGDWEAAEDVNITVTPHVSRKGWMARLRFVLEEVKTVSASKTITPKFKYQKNGAGGYVDMPTSADYDLFDLAVTSANAPAILLSESNEFTDGAATTGLLSGKTFVAGYGSEDQVNANVTLNNQRTELEINVWIPRFYDTAGTGTPSENDHNDYYEIRVYDGDTLLDGTYTTPRITLSTTDTGYIGGCYPESSGRYGPYTDSSGKMYLAVEIQESTATIMMLASTDGGKTWQPIGTADTARPTDTDMEGVDIIQDGFRILIGHNAGTVINYYEFCMSDAPNNPDQWVASTDTDALIGKSETIVSFTGAENQDVAITKKSGSGTAAGYVYIFYTKSGDSAHYVFHNTTSWSAEQTLDATAGEDFTGIRAVADDQGLDYIVYHDYTGSVCYYKWLNANGALQSRTSVYTDPRSSGSGQQDATLQPVFWNNGTNRKIMFGFHDESDEMVYTRIITDTGSGYGSPATAEAASDSAAADNSEWINSRQVNAFLVVDTDTDVVYLFYSDSTDEDIYWNSNSDGAGWGTDTEINDGVRCHMVRGNIFTHSSGNGGATVVGYVWEEGGYGVIDSGFDGGIRYDEYVISTADEQRVFLTTI